MPNFASALSQEFNQISAPICQGLAEFDQVGASRPTGGAAILYFHDFCDSYVKN